MGKQFKRKPGPDRSSSKMFELYIFLGVLSLLYLYLTWNHNHWKKKGIPQVEPLPIIGNLLDALLLKKSIMHINLDIYKKFPDASVIGFYMMSTPALLLKSPELVQTVLVKDFSSFHDNYVFADENQDPYMYRDSFFSQGMSWKIHRSAMVPAFNLGKVKSIFPQMKEICKQLEEYLDSNLNTDIEAKNLAFLFTTDVVSNCAFGISGNSFTGTEAVFKKMGALMINEVNNPYKIFAIMAMPNLAKFLKWSFIPEAVGNYLKNVITQTEDYRIKNNVERNDFLQYILNLRGKKQNQDNNSVYSTYDIVGYAMTFFVEGFETSAITASFTLYELAKNPEIQETLRAEILSSVTKIEDLDYDKLQTMTYLDNVVSETLRKYPIMFSMTRVCTQNTTLNVEGKTLKVEKGTPIVIPVYNLHTNPKYFPNPEKYDPERFTPENVSSRPQYSYLPFGEGPRICIGMRFGLTQVKLFLITILLKYNILCTNKTPKQMKFNKLSLLTTSVEEPWLKFEKIAA